MRHDTHLQDVAEIQQHVCQRLVKETNQLERETQHGNLQTASEAKSPTAL